MGSDYVANQTQILTEPKYEDGIYRLGKKKTNFAHGDGSRDGSNTSVLKPLNGWCRRLIIASQSNSTLPGNVKSSGTLFFRE